MADEFGAGGSPTCSNSSSRGLTSTPRRNHVRTEARGYRGGERRAERHLALRGQARSRREVAPAAGGRPHPHGGGGPTGGGASRGVGGGGGGPSPARGWGGGGRRCPSG